MTNNEAKFLLGAYRANGRDAANQVFGDALAQAQQDPALGAWFARAQAHDAAISGKLREVTPPACLREAILAGSRASRAPKQRWSTPAPWFALAASMAVILTATVALWPNRAAAESERFAAFAIDDTAHGKHGGHGEAEGALQAMLSAPTTKLSAALPVDFAKLQTSGCRVVKFAGHDVLEVCFNRNGEWFHCYIANRVDFPAMPAAVFRERANLASASWSDATHHFVVVSEAGLDAVKRLL